MTATTYRTCPRSGLQFESQAEKLMIANAVAAVVALLVAYGRTKLVVDEDGLLEHRRGLGLYVRPGARDRLRQAARARFLGQELDLIGKYVIGPRSNILFGYSHFWRGDKILAPKDADFAYSQWEVNF